MLSNDNIVKHSDEINNILKMFELEPDESDQNQHTEVIEKIIELNDSSQMNYYENSTYNISNIHSNEYKGVSKGILFLMMSIIIIVLLVIGASFESPYEENHAYNKEKANQSTTSAPLNIENNQIEKDVTHLLNLIDYDLASYHMSREYTSAELRNLAKAFNSLDYYIETSFNDIKYFLIAYTVDFQIKNNLQVDGMIGPITLSELGKAMVAKQWDYNVKYNVKNDNSVVKEYGWNSYYVDRLVYFVSYEFDYDYDYDNGYLMYAYEVNLNNQTVSAIEGQLQEKYRRLGFVE